MGCNQSQADSITPSSQNQQQGTQPATQQPSQTQNLIDSRSWTDQQSPGYKKSGFIRNIIKTQNTCQLVGKTKISEKNIFSVRIVQLFSPIGLGIINEKYANKESLDSLQQPTWFQYRSDKKVWNNSKSTLNVGKGYDSGDIVTITVDTKVGTIAWAVGKQTRHTIKHDCLKQKDVQWRPYIFIQGTLDDSHPTQLALES